MCVKNAKRRPKIITAFVFNLQVSEAMLPVLTEGGKDFSVNFDLKKYERSRSAKILGNTIIYTDVIPTTMTVLDG